VAAGRAFVNIQAVLTNTVSSRAEAEPLVRYSFEYYRTHNDAWGNATLYPFTAFDGGFLAEREALLTSIEMFRALGDDRGAANRLGDLGELVHHAGYFAEARQYFDESVALAQAMEDRYWVSFMLDCSGYVARQMGLFAESRAQHTESLALSREIGDQLGVSGSLDNLGLLAFELGDRAEARRQFEAALALRQLIGQPYSLAVTLEHLGRLALAEGDLASAEAYLQEALAVDHGFPLASLRLGDLRLAQGRPAEALDLIRPVVRQTLDFGIVWMALDALTSLAQALSRAGQPALALEALALVLGHHACDYATRQRAAARQAELGAGLPRALGAEAEARGRAASLEAMLTALAIPTSAQPVGGA
jgi:tetratricopeptide (TPR) repeat protein